jgi:hypothetical protein
MVPNNQDSVLGTRLRVPYIVGVQRYEKIGILRLVVTGSTMRYNRRRSIVDQADTGDVDSR